MLIRNKREFLARRLRDIGLLYLLEHARRRPVLLVLTYHRIGSASASPYYGPIFSATPDDLREQIRYLRNHFHMPVVDAVDPEEPVHEPTALVTFDDGYRDNVDAALPILSELGIPAVFFLPAALIDQPRLPWWDHASYVIKRTELAQVTLDEPSRLTLNLVRDGWETVLRQVIQLYLDGLIPDEASFRAHLEQRAELAVDDQALGRDLFLNWADAKRLADSGISVGSHGLTHRRLSALPEDEQRDELVRARTMLQERTGQSVTALAYPFGWAGTFTTTTEYLAREAGYRRAFSAIEGVNRPGTWNPFALRRLNIGASDSPTLVRARAVCQTQLGRSFV